MRLVGDFVVTDQQMLFVGFKYHNSLQILNIIDKRGSKNQRNKGATFSGLSELSI